MVSLREFHINTLLLPDTERQSIRRGFMTATLAGHLL